ncbi:TPA: hypothetical protein ACKP1B_004475 [Serratia fonticola]
MQAESKPETEFVISGVENDILYSLAAVARALKKTKNEIIVELIKKEFVNPVTTYAQTSLLVKAMDRDICERFSCSLIERDKTNDHTILSERTYRSILNLVTKDDIDALFKKYISLIEYRASQVCSRKGYTQLPAGISLTFALFIAVACSTPEVIESIWQLVFQPTDNEGYFYNDVNAIRNELGLQQVDPVLS